VLEKKVVKGKKLTFVRASEPLSRWRKWTGYDDDLGKFADSEDDYWNVVVPRGVDAKELRAGLRSRIRAKFADRIRLVSLTEGGELKLQLQKVKK